MAVSSSGAAVWRLVMDSPQEANELGAVMRKYMHRFSLRTQVVGDEVHVFNDRASQWAATLSQGARGAFPSDPPPPAQGVCR